MREAKELYDFKAFGQAIKEARISRGWTRERLAQEVALAPRYLMSIENKGQHPSFQVFYELVTLFHISVDQFFFPDKEMDKSTQRRQLESLLDDMSDKGLR
ncbi:MAG TPA: transcriptional regulator, partial [Firmicutes bacterium]|nr:transcriptional regulator [Bacillota bacterium]